MAGALFLEGAGLRGFALLQPRNWVGGAWSICQMGPVVITDRLGLQRLAAGACSGAELGVAPARLSSAAWLCRIRTGLGGSGNDVIANFVAGFDGQNLCCWNSGSCSKSRRRRTTTPEESRSSTRDTQIMPLSVAGTGSDHFASDHHHR